MNKYFKSLWQLLSLIVILSVGVSCSDTWDDHYSTNSDVSDVNSIAARLSKMPDASNFVEALKTTKMLKVNDNILSTSFYDFLSSDQFVTLWVPSNESMPDSIWDIFTKENKSEAENVYTAKRLIMNYLARYNFTIGENADTIDVLMMNKKHHTLISNKTIDEAEYKEDGNGNRLINIACSNGIIHLLADNPTKGTISYKPTIFEFLTTDLAYRPLIGELLEKYSESYLDENKSVPSGIDEEGRMVYIDSVTYEVNRLLSGHTDYISKGLGLIDSEDSSFIMVLPSPEGWAVQYDSLISSFDFGIQDSPNDSLQTLWAKTAMIRDAIFNRNLQRSPLDSVCSTLYNFIDAKTIDDINLHRFNKPYDINTGIFRKNLQDSVICSNGVIYITKDWNLDRYTVYNPKIVVDCTSYSKVDCYTDFEYADSTKTGIIVEEEPNRNVQDGFILRVGAGGRTDPWYTWKVSYMIHDVVAGTYILKLVVTNGEDDNNPKPINIHPTVNFYYNSDPNYSGYTSSSNELVLVKETTGTGARKRNKVYNNVIYSDASNLVRKLTDTIVVTKPVVVPKCTYGMKYASLQVNINNVVPANVDNFSPFLFLDRIILEPVKE